ncbi:MAG: hypothetical protein ABSH56_35330 [Bryobacteraceae bacterium]|jgi:hypothetical protein
MRIAALREVVRRLFDFRIGVEPDLLAGDMCAQVVAARPEGALPGMVQLLGERFLQAAAEELPRQRFLYFLPLPQGHMSLGRFGFGAAVGFGFLCGD